MPTTIRIPKALLEEADRKARTLRISRSRFIVQALEKELSAPADWPPGFFEQLGTVPEVEKPESEKRTVG